MEGSGQSISCYILQELGCFRPAPCVGIVNGHEACVVLGYAEPFFVFNAKLQRRNLNAREPGAS